MKRLELLIFVLQLLPVIDYAAESPETIRGTCMGTKYAVTVVDRPTGLPLASLEEQIGDELERIEQIFSLYRPTSELSRLNAATSGEWIGVSTDLLAVTKRAANLAEATGGAFDPTVGPLLKLWRLRQVSTNWSPPTREAIAETMQRVGWRKFEIREDPPGIRKLTDGVELDLNALGEGWAIDRMTQLLAEERIESALIELGGEFRGLGHKANGEPWRIGIENPREAGACYATVQLQDHALSTSGNYREPIEHQGRHYGHILDARRGEPVQHDLLSVSVIATDATTADGWATALLALGPLDGPALAEKHDIAASFVIKAAPLKNPRVPNQIRIHLTTRARGKVTLLETHNETDRILKRTIP